MQAAIDGLAAGSTIRICAGTYSPITVSKSLTLIGAGQGSNAASYTILDAAGSGRVVSVDNGTTVSPRRLRITGGNGVFFGGGIYNEGNLTLAACTVAQNTAQDSGGGIYNDSPGKIALIDSMVSMNTAGNTGGGIFTEGIVTLNGAPVSDNTPNNRAGSAVAGCSG